MSGGHVTALDTSQLERYVSIARAEGFGGDWMGQTVALGMGDSIRSQTGWAEFSDEYNTAYKEALTLLAVDAVPAGHAAGGLAPG